MPFAYRTVGPWSVLVLLAVSIPSCGKNGSDGQEAMQPPGGSVTMWTDSTELFMEHPALIVGTPAKFAVHLTDLSDFSPLRSGAITLEFRPQSGGEGFTIQQQAPRSPGIYGPSPQFPKPGLWDLTIHVASQQATDAISVFGLPVYPTAAEVPSDDGGAPSGIVFLKEQQWKTPGFRTEFATEGRVSLSFTATGQIVPAAGRFAEVAAPIAGLVDTEGIEATPAPGHWVKRGQTLVTLAGALGEAGSAYAEARRELREAEDEYARAKRLYDVEAVPRRRLHEAEIRLDAARETLAGLGGALTADGRLPIRSPLTGVVTSRTVAAGSRVAPGDRLFTILDPTTVWLRVNVPAAQSALVAGTGGAEFELEGSSRTYQSSRLISVGSVVDSASRSLEIIFEVRNADRSIPVGANARARVRTGRQAAGVLVPSSTILEEDGRSIAYVQVAGELFEKRDLQVAGQERGLTLITSGIAIGERVVTGAAYQVRLASLSTGVPAHGHEH